MRSANFGQILILVKNRNFGQKSKFWPKIEILVKNRNFGQKSKFLSKIEILVKNRNKNPRKIYIFDLIDMQVVWR